MTNNRYQGKTLAYRRFQSSIWKTQSMLELGVVGIDQKIEKEYSSLLKKFEKVKGVPGPKPKKHKPIVESKKTEDGQIEFTLDVRSAALLKKVLEEDKRRHDELRFFLYSNIFVGVWGALETYSQMLFEELLTSKPDMLKSKESMLIEDVVSSRNNIVEYLVERQVEAIGHFKIDDLLAYFKKKINFSPTTHEAKIFRDYYFIRNIIAHKSGIVRAFQKQKLPTGVKVVDDEIQISELFLNKMIKNIEKLVTKIEKNVDTKFYKKT